jgi:hypothetical protein
MKRVGVSHTDSTLPVRICIYILIIQVYEYVNIYVYTYICRCVYIYWMSMICKGGKVVTDEEGRCITYRFYFTGTLHIYVLI